MSYMVVGLTGRTFEDGAAGPSLPALLADARQRGADLVVLPELPLLSAAALESSRAAELAEDLEGLTMAGLSKAARTEAISLLGGGLTRGSQGGVVRVTGMLFAVYGELLATASRPLDSPSIEAAVLRASQGQTEAHKVDGLEVIDTGWMRTALVMGSEASRPGLAEALAEAACEVVLCPRSSREAEHGSWRAALEALARQSGCYVLSPTRSALVGEAASGGPSLALGPDGALLLEGSEPLMLVELESERVEAIRRAGRP
jgi:predicted amidohydrolase